MNVKSLNPQPDGQVAGCFITDTPTGTTLVPCNPSVAATLSTKKSESQHHQGALTLPGQAICFYRGTAAQEVNMSLNLSKLPLDRSKAFRSKRDQRVIVLPQVDY